MALGISVISSDSLSSITASDDTRAFIVCTSVVRAIINTPILQIMGDPRVRFVIAVEIDITSTGVG